MVPAAYNEVLGAALALSPNLRAMLAEHLLQSLDAEPQADIDALWAEEAEQRVQSVDQGKVAAIPGEQILGELRSRHR
ncbi:addiction module protein [Leptolyngbyaceae cyanobacterium UHCC 1019]